MTPDINENDVFETPRGIIQVESITDLYVTVTDPMDNHPQSSRAGTWEIDREAFEYDVEQGNLKPVSQEVVGEDEVVIDRKTLATLADHANAEATVSDYSEVYEAVATAYEELEVPEGQEIDPSGLAGGNS